MPKSKKRSKALAASAASKAPKAAVKPAVIDAKAIIEKAQGRPCLLQLLPSDKPDLALHKRYRDQAVFPLRGVIDMQLVATADMRFLEPLKALPDGFFQCIYLSNVLERLYAHQRRALLAELARLVALGGEMLLSAPDAQMAASYVASGLLDEALFRSPLGDVSASDLLFGYAPPIEKGHLQAAHHSAVTARALAEDLSQAGFCSIDITRRWLDLWCLCHRFAPDDSRYQAEARIKIDLSHPSAHYPPLPPAFQFRHPGMIDGFELSDDLDAPPLQYQPLT